MSEYTKKWEQFLLEAKNKYYAWENAQKKKKITSRHPEKEKGMPTGWSHSRDTEVRSLVLAMHENILHIGKLIEKATNERK